MQKYIILGFYNGIISILINKGCFNPIPPPTPFNGGFRQTRFAFF